MDAQARPSGQVQQSSEQHLSAAVPPWFKLLGNPLHRIDYTLVLFKTHEWTFLLQVAWRQCCMKVAGEDWSVVSSKMNEHAVKADKLWAAFLADKKGFHP